MIDKNSGIWCKINRLTYTKYLWVKHYWKKKVNLWEFLCNCWNIVELPITVVKNWYTKSCWCLRKEKSVSSNIKHWMSYTRFNNIFRWIKTRCTNPNRRNYYRYWWKWIECEWKSFEEFKDNMYKDYLEHCKIHWKEDTTIERINNDWNYSKENCRWATKKEQAQNRDNTNMIWNNK